MRRSGSGLSQNKTYLLHRHAQTEAGLQTDNAAKAWATFHETKLTCTGPEQARFFEEALTFAGK